MATSCKTQQSSTQTPMPVQHNPRPVTMLAPTIIYKTTGDYDNLVPVTLNADGTGIATYPARTDVGRNGNYLTPVKLDGGYLLDRKGVTASSAFTDYTYEQYSSLPATPSTSELMKHVKYKQPFIEMYAVEGLSNPSVEQLNEIIKNGFTGCRAIIIDGKIAK